MKKIAMPLSGEYPSYYESYFSLIAKDVDIIDVLTKSNLDTIDLYTSVDGETLNYRYAEGKWNMFEILQHLLDTERILAYRALRIARGDKENINGFDENIFVETSGVANRNLMDMVREYSLLRASTIELFKSFSETALLEKGSANGKTVTPAALAYFIATHEMHHIKIIEERYLPK
ncbi:MAG: DinB family protein [Bacteroidia bacterium]|nr:DinB family protein [Bacteroidia bacterium]MCZ2140423.1 DinB family protein [Bacteroidia bacterium]